MFFNVNFWFFCSVLSHLLCITCNYLFKILDFLPLTCMVLKTHSTISFFLQISWTRNIVVNMDFGINPSFQSQYPVTLGKSLWVPLTSLSKRDDQIDIVCKDVSQAVQIQVFNKCWLFESTHIDYRYYNINHVLHL